MDKPSPINKLLRSSNIPVAGVLQHGQFLHRLERLLDTLLDKDFRLHCRVGNVRDGLLILYSDSTAWATRLRYQTPHMLQKLQQRKGLEQLQGIEVRVLPDKKKEPTYQRVGLSSEASSCLTACADTVADEGLRKALQRLASHHNKVD